MGSECCAERKSQSSAHTSPRQTTGTAPTSRAKVSRHNSDGADVMSVDDILEVVEKLMEEHLRSKREQMEIMKKYYALNTHDQEVDAVLANAGRMREYCNFLEQLDRAVLTVNSAKAIEFLRLDREVRRNLQPAELAELREYVNIVKDVPASCHPPDPFWQKVAFSLQRQQQAGGQLLQAFLQYGRRMQTLSDKVSLKVVKYGNHPVLAEQVREARATTMKLAAEEIETRNLLVSRVEAGRAATTVLTHYIYIERVAADVSTALMQLDNPAMNLPS